jgi:tetratricopeptide (TPR) repeat protein
LDSFSEFARLEDTHAFLGKLDYRCGRASSAARYFRATQLAANGSHRLAIGLLEELARNDQPTPVIHRWLADQVSEQGLALFQRGQTQAAEDAWRRALRVDPTQIYRRLLVAVVRARVDRDDPDGIAAMTDPLLDRLSQDRALRAAFLAMLGDAYFEAGRFSQARVRYQESLRAYGLPKHINHRAQRGLLGM